MELVALYKRVIGLDIHQAQITACALIEESDGTTRIEQRQFGGFKRDRRKRSFSDALPGSIGRCQDCVRNL